MIKRITMTNIEIFNTANALMEAFGTEQETSFPVKVNFFLQKNMKSIVEMAQEIDKTRVEIMQKYGTLDEETQQFTFEQDQMDAANTELEGLFNLEQEVKTNMLDINLFDNVDMTNAQVSAISYMIYDPDEEE